MPLLGWMVNLLCIGGLPTLLITTDEIQNILSSMQMLVQDFMKNWNSTLPCILCQAWFHLLLDIYLGLFLFLCMCQT